MNEREWLADKCKKCHKLRQASELYFCSGCGYGKFEDENFAWEEITIIEKEMGL